MSENIVTWESLDAFEQLALELLLEGGESLLTPNAGRVYDGLIAKGLVGRNWNDIRGMYFVLTDAALALMSTATPAPTDELARLQAENARLKEALTWYADSRNYSKSEMWIDPANGQECHIQVVSIFVDVRAIEALGGE